MLLPPSAQTLAFPRLSRLGARRLTRAHLLWPSRSQVHAELATALEAVGTGLGSALGGPVGVTARLLPSASGTARLLPRRSVFALLDLSSVGSPAVLEVEPPFATAVLAAVAGGRPQRGPSNSLTRIERAAWGYLLLEVILAARSSAFIREQLAPRLLSVHDFREEFGARLPKVPWVTVELGLRFAAMEGTALLHLPAHALQMALQQVPQSSRDEPAAEGGLAAVDVEFAVTAASHVPTSDWARLTAGDVVMVDRLSGGLPAWRGTVALQTAGFELEGVLDAGRFAFTRARRRASPPESSMPQPHSMDDVTCTLPLALQVELGTAQVPIGALHALKPGAVVSLHLNPASPVSLKLGGRTVARAELVDVDGAVGARILEVLP